MTRFISSQQTFAGIRLYIDKYKSYKLSCHQFGLNCILPFQWQQNPYTVGHRAVHLVQPNGSCHLIGHVFRRQHREESRFDAAEHAGRNVRRTH